MDQLERLQDYIEQHRFFVELDNRTAGDVALVEGVAGRCWESIERSHITRELRASEAYFRTITHAMPQIVWTASADGVVEYWNERMYEFIGIPAGSQDGVAWTELVHPDDRASAAHDRAASVASGAACETTYRVRHHAGDWRWTLARAMPVHHARHLKGLVDDLLDAARVTQDIVTLQMDRVAPQQVVADAAGQVHAAFDLFHQGERTLDRAQGGLGIGLALVKSLVERHGGQVAAHSAGPSQGGTFTVTRPRRAAAAGEADDAVAAMAPPGARHVLVVDDNADAAQTVAMLLQVLGHETAVEYDPLQALACVREHKFDAFVLDIGLPGMDGHELARQMRKLPGAAGALFIALTGYGQQQDRDASSAAGFHYHFVKPANVDALARALANGLPE